MNIDEYKKLALPKKRGKYRNIPSVVEGYRFDSTREGLRWIQLRQLERDGEITKLQRQVVFPLVVNGELACRYKADFVYVKHGNRIVEDVKGVHTDMYRLKKKLMKILLGIDILET